MVPLHSFQNVTDSQDPKILEIAVLVHCGCFARTSWNNPREIANSLLARKVQEPLSFDEIKAALPRLSRRTVSCGGLWSKKVIFSVKLLLASVATTLVLKGALLLYATLGPTWRHTLSLMSHDLTETTMGHATGLLLKACESLERNKREDNTKPDYGAYRLHSP